ncbi:GNAT family N-acetyltransferase [Streptomyces meridianus]|uniref:GNAT family N-acetyltransferase n=1 Tax=Streptomyces meridianus TaxID=2938945 RepID=A0ABT0X0A1_9ACTN|nr:GNAT family N-acetyltransferase [Streptomyces meridianus]MCM2575997.1 GNAT family N-acetyltransferase [Streptomyces meridianus]
MTTELRSLRPDEWDRWFRMLEVAFGGVAESPQWRARYRELTEFERSVGVWDGDTCVGASGAFSFRMTVPGGASVPTAGVTMVGVLPTHRRRGILRSMMRRQLDNLRERGEPLAALTASEPVIYGRFGYGVASEQLSAEIDTARVRLDVPEGTGRVRLRLTEPDSVREECEAVYAAAVPTRPGMLARMPGWDQVPLLDPEQDRAGASPLQCVVAESGGRVTGFARYAVRPDWDASGANGAVLLRDLYAPDPAVYAALWQFLLDIDLTSRIEVRSSPADAPWRHLVSDVRRCGLRVRDGVHLRLVDVGRALELRSYARELDTVLDVTDPFCPWNEGSWRLAADSKGASCERTTAPAELALSVNDLASAYLGGTSLAALAGTGRVRELRPGALAAASAAFHSDVAPWLPHGF